MTAAQNAVQVETAAVRGFTRLCEKNRIQRHPDRTVLHSNILIAAAAMAVDERLFTSDARKRIGWLVLQKAEPGGMNTFRTTPCAHIGIYVGDAWLRTYYDAKSPPDAKEQRSA